MSTSSVHRHGRRRQRAKQRGPRTRGGGAEGASTAGPAKYAEPLLQGAFSALFRARPILFAGCGPADDDLDVVLDRVRALAALSPLRNFALAAVDTVTPFRRFRLRKHGAVTAVPLDLAARS